VPKPRRSSSKRSENKICVDVVTPRRIGEAGSPPIRYSPKEAAVRRTTGRLPLGRPVVPLKEIVEAIGRRLLTQLSEDAIITGLVEISVARQADAGPPKMSA
jgi:hypothetical protein